MKTIASFVFVLVLLLIADRLGKLIPLAPVLIQISFSVACITLFVFELLLFKRQSTSIWLDSGRSLLLMSILVTSISGLVRGTPRLFLGFSLSSLGYMAIGGVMLVLFGRAQELYSKRRQLF